MQLMDGRMKGSAFVRFPSSDAAHRALLDVHGYLVEGKPLILVRHACYSFLTRMRPSEPCLSYFPSLPSLQFSLISLLAILAERLNGDVCLAKPRYPEVVFDSLWFVVCGLEPQTPGDGDGDLCSGSAYCVTNLENGV